MEREIIKDGIKEVVYSLVIDSDYHRWDSIAAKLKAKVAEYENKNCLSKSYACTSNLLLEDLWTRFLKVFHEKEELNGRMSALHFASEIGEALSMVGASADHAWGVVLKQAIYPSPYEHRLVIELVIERFDILPYEIEVEEA